jgi:hypothetical protein
VIELTKTLITTTSRLTVILTAILVAKSRMTVAVSRVVRTLEAMADTRFRPRAVERTICSAYPIVPATNRVAAAVLIIALVAPILDSIGRETTSVRLIAKVAGIVDVSVRMNTRARAKSVVNPITLFCVRPSASAFVGTTVDPSEIATVRIVSRRFVISVLKAAETAVVRVNIPVRATSAVIPMSAVADRAAICDRAKVAAIVMELLIDRVRVPPLIVRSQSAVWESDELAVRASITTRLVVRLCAIETEISSSLVNARSMIVLVPTLDSSIRAVLTDRDISPLTAMLSVMGLVTVDDRTTLMV